MFLLPGNLPRSDRDRLPANKLAVFGIICGLSFLLAFALTGNQIFYANWALVDDWEPFGWIGPGQNRLPFSDIWDALLTKTEVGVPGGRFRPAYYFLKMVEMATWGTNVHLWYFARTLEFTVFIASIWWITSRFVGIWLGGILLIPILAMPFWADVWARLGPSEAYGSGALGVLLLGAYGVFAGQSSRLRAVAATIVTVATIILLGVKETFVPFAGLGVAVLLIAYARQRLSLPLVVVLVAITGFVGVTIILFVKKTVSGGADYYANSIDLSPIIAIAKSSFIHAISYWGPVYLAAALSFAMVERKQQQSLRRWATASSITAAIFIFLVVMYVSQCMAYRSQLPLNMRYDFPGALFVPANYCLLSCYAAYMARPHFPPWFNWIVVGFVISLGSLLIPKAASQFRPIELPKAAYRNIQRTDKFFRELQSIVSAAKSSPERPIIFETHEPWSWSYEPVFSLSTYLETLGARNPVSIRMHPGDGPSGALDEGLKKSMTSLQDQGNERFVPLAKNAENIKDGCISVGINGPAAPNCTGFRISVE